MATKTADEQAEVVLGNLLRAGVLLSAAVTALGGVVYLVRHGEETTEYRSFGTGMPAELRRPESVIAGTIRGSGRAVVQLGLLLLIATPVARVALSAFLFARQRDYLYVGLTLFVLGVLLFGLFFGGGG